VRDPGVRDVDAESPVPAVCYRPTKNPFLPTTGLYAKLANRRTIAPVRAETSTTVSQRGVVGFRWASAGVLPTLPLLAARYAMAPMTAATPRTVARHRRYGRTDMQSAWRNPARLSACACTDASERRPVRASPTHALARRTGEGALPPGGVFREKATDGLGALPALSLQPACLDGRVTNSRPYPPEG
jgi:hypothetical protein